MPQTGRYFGDRPRTDTPPLTDEHISQLPAIRKWAEDYADAQLALGGKLEGGWWVYPNGTFVKLDGKQIT